MADTTGRTDQPRPAGTDVAAARSRGGQSDSGAGRVPDPPTGDLQAIGLAQCPARSVRRGAMPRLHQMQMGSRGPDPDHNSGLLRAPKGRSWALSGPIRRPISSLTRCQSAGGRRSAISPVGIFFRSSIPFPLLSVAFPLPMPPPTFRLPLLLPELPFPSLFPMLLFPLLFPELKFPLPLPTLLLPLLLPVFPVAGIRTARRRPRHKTKRWLSRNDKQFHLEIPFVGLLFAGWKTSGNSVWRALTQHLAR